ncbi:hypothetical protein [Allosphingosinicella vermicomposti]|uniref:hypothetical protein n=1 Tax=Allosphingosinicella vermicomposti TaxID=614671 RepID=UPI00131A4F28|nr:hypothetical protein [Allosphingosinicella vermicomposti]
MLDTMIGSPIDRLNFLGEWYDPASNGLILRGSGEIEGMGRRTNPRYSELEVRRRFPSGWSPEHPSHDMGNYAYAFSQPPLGLLSGYAVVEAMFREINDLILQPGDRHRIRNWSGYDLTRLSDYFNAGAEYWGTFLFTIVNEPSGRLVVISASASD